MGGADLTILVDVELLIITLIASDSGYLACRSIFVELLAGFHFCASSVEDRAI